MSNNLPNDELLGRYLNDVASDDDLASLQEQLVTCPDAADALVELARFELLIRSQLCDADHRLEIKDLLARLPSKEELVDDQSGIAIKDELVVAGAGLPRRLDAPDLESQIPNPPFPTLSTTNYPLPATPFVGSWAFSYMVATVIMGVMLLGFWAIKITHHQHIAEAPSVPSEVRQEMVFVGRITGMVDVKWSDDPRYLPPPDFAHVPLDRKYKLDAGLMEITYDSGAKVILQGPCTYEVESTAGGYLAMGKLTAKVEAGGGKGSRSKVQGSRSKAEPSSFILHPSSLFSVRTPTAIVTDLGTEFGVEVSEEGNTSTHVFRGKVELRSAGGDDVIPLGENESARVERGQGRVVKVIRESVQPSTFARQMPRRVRIELFNTGVGLQEGDLDPHWQLVARSDDPKFKPRQAVVTGPHSWMWLPNDPTRSQWISTGHGPPDLPDCVTYTFRATFEFVDMVPGTAVLRGRFIADNYVKAIRLNGKEVPLPEDAEDAQFAEFREFSAEKGFVEGTNTLEIDVANGQVLDSSGGTSPMGLRIELNGFVFLGRKAPTTTSGDAGGRGLHLINRGQPRTMQKEANSGN